MEEWLLECNYLQYLFLSGQHSAPAATLPSETGCGDQASLWRPEDSSDPGLSTQREAEAKDVYRTQRNEREGGRGGGVYTHSHGTHKGQVSAHPPQTAIAWRLKG